jgi:hypothetical protein
MLANSETNSNPKGAEYPRLSGDAAAPPAEPNTNLAIGFLDGLDPRGRHHLSAIALSGMITTEAFDPSERARMRAWLDAHQGKANLYYSPDEARPGARRDSKLTKEELGTIRAVVLDVDPTKVKGGDPSGEHFRRERERLLAVVGAAAADAMCPPTLIVNSGGGFQFIYHLNPSLPATAENIELVEGISRTLIKKFGGDSGTWNADRLMRLPGTVNVPTPQKAAQGRKPATATVLTEQSSGQTFTIEQLAAWAPPTTATTSTKNADANYPEVDMTAVQEVVDYDSLPAGLREKFEARRALDESLQRVWSGKRAPLQKDETGSGSALALAGCLKTAGNFTHTEFGQLLRVFEHGQDEAKVDARAIKRTWLNAPLQPAHIDTAEGFEVVDHLAAFNPRWLDKFDPATIPKRDWIIEGLAARGKVTVIVGPGGVAKSTWANQCGVAVATGRPDMSGFAVPRRHRAWVWNQEDDEQELDRRMGGCSPTTAASKPPSSSRGSTAAQSALAMRCSPTFESGSNRSASRC